VEDSYLTISGISEGLYSEKGSKFIAFAFPVENEIQVKENILSLKKKYYDARHHVYAFVIGSNQEFYRCSDDGEPSNSSGPPVLGQIRSFNLTNVLVVVVRYFGGTKLGVSGLLNAYKTAARDALDKAIVIQKYVKAKYISSFGYEEMNFVMKCLKDFDAEISSQNFAESCSIIFSIRLSLSDKLLNALKQNHKLKTEICNE
jgi:uncharacterized YigZ family protein